MPTKITKQEAKLYLELVEVAYSEGLLSKKAYELGEVVRNKYYPKKYDWIFKSIEKGICPNCDEPLEPIYENNGFTAPDPTHDEITGYKQCECERGEE